MEEKNTLSRPHTVRLQTTLAEVRSQLTKLVHNLSESDLDWSPRPDLKMKSYKQILQEIGTMEKLTLHMAKDQEELDWDATWDSLDKPDVASLMADLTAIREETLQFLSSCSEEKLETPILLTEEWQQYFSEPSVEPEVLMQWIVRHEYYHVGQIVTFHWQRGVEC